MIRSLRQQSKSILYALCAIAVIVLAYIIQRQAIIPIVALFLCGVMLSSSVKDATYVLLLISSISAIINYSGLTYYIFIVAAYILNIVMKGRYIKGLSWMVVIIAYCVLLANPSVEFKIGSLTAPIYIVMAVFMCDNLEREDMRKAIDCYTEGFIISIIIGFFVDKLPALSAVLRSVSLVIDGSVFSQGRFGGLFSDPNFFTAVNSIVVSIILFTNKKFTARNIIILAFLIIVGFFSYSKSYLLTLALILCIYLVKNGTHVVRNILLLSGLIITFLIVEYALKLNVLSLLLSRFETVEDVNDLTTGRWDLWQMYMESIFADAKILFFGDGYNTQTIYRAAHNTFIEFWYRFGIMGCALWFFCIKSCFDGFSRDERGKRVKINTVMPILVFCSVYLFLSAFICGYLGLNICIIVCAMYMQDEEDLLNARVEHNSTHI